MSGAEWEDPAHNPVPIINRRRNSGITDIYRPIKNIYDEIVKRVGGSFGGRSKGFTKLVLSLDHSVAELGGR